MAWWIFQNVVVIAVLAAVVLLVSRVSRIGPVARHALWVLVLLKFVTPPLVVWPWAAPDPLGLSAREVIADSSRVLVLEGTGPSPSAQLDADALVSSAPAAPVVLTIAPNQSGRGPSSMWPWILVFWAAGSLTLFAIEAVRLARLARRVRAASPADPAIVNRVAELSWRLGLPQVPVVTIADSDSPVVWCVGHPVLLWPADLPADSSEACIDGLLVHELAHVKRLDHFVGWIELVAGVIWWWNPLFWYVRSARREQAELACDAWVISALPNGRRAYAESLLALSGAAVRATPMAVVAIRASSRRVLERRLVMIMKGRAPLRLPWVGLLTLAVVAALTLPAWATSQQAATTVTQAQAAPAAPAAQPSQAAKPAPVAVAQTTTTPAKVPTQTTTVVPTIQAPRAVHVTQTVTVPEPAHAPARVVTHIAPQPAHSISIVQDGQAKTIQVKPSTARPMFHLVNKTSLPEDGQKLIQSYETDREAIQKEIDQKLEARRQAAIKALEALQEQYTKAGKLDEAVAIRDYLRAGGPDQSRFFTWIRKQ